MIVMEATGRAWFECDVDWSMNRWCPTELGVECAFAWRSTGTRVARESRSEPSDRVSARTATKYPTVQVHYSLQSDFTRSKHRTLNRLFSCSPAHLARLTAVHCSCSLFQTSTHRLSSNHVSPASIVFYCSTLLTPSYTPSRRDGHSVQPWRIFRSSASARHQAQTRRSR